MMTDDEREQAKIDRLFEKAAAAHAKWRLAAEHRQAAEDDYIAAQKEQRKAMSALHNYVERRVKGSDAAAGTAE